MPTNHQNICIKGDSGSVDFVGWCFRGLLELKPSMAGATLSPFKLQRVTIILPTFLFLNVLQYRVTR